MKTIKPFLEQLLNHQSLSEEDLNVILESFIEQTIPSEQISAFLALMRMKGETPLELAGAAKFLLSKAKRIPFDEPLLDIVGTGGDGLSTFNVSTVSSFVVASSGVNVAKHGNKAVSSKSGSADLLTAAGFKLDISNQTLLTTLQQTHLAFLFAPHFHPALQAIKEVRQALGVRTMFNLLGPLINPAKITAIVLGVFDKKWLSPMALVLKELGLVKGCIIHSEDGLDEISIAARTMVVEYKEDTIHSFEINPKDYGLAHASLEKVIINSKEESLALALGVLNQEKGAHRDIILLNSALGILCSGKVKTFAEGIEVAREMIDSGKALHCFNETKRLMNIEYPE